MTAKVDLQDFCWPPNNDSFFWADKAYSYCTELPDFDVTSYALLAVASGLSIGHIQHSEHKNLKRFWALRARFALSIVSSFLPVIGVILNLTHSAKLIAPFPSVRDGCAFFAWAAHALYLLKLLKARQKLVRGYLPVLFAWTLSLLSTVVRVAKVTGYVAQKDQLELEEIGRILTFVEFALQLLYLVLLLPSHSQKQVAFEGNHDEECSVVSDLGVAAEEAGFLSKLLLWWIRPLLKQGAQGKLRNADDVFRLPKYLQTLNVQDYFGRILNGELADRVTGNREADDLSKLEKKTLAGCAFSKEQIFSVFGWRSRGKSESTLSERPTLLRALVRAFGVHFIFLGVAKFCLYVTRYAGPLLLNALVTFIEDGEEPVQNGLLYAFILSLSTLLHAFVSIHYHYQTFKMITRMRAALVTTIYRKALVVSSTAASRFTTGEITNMMSVDVDRVKGICWGLHESWGIPFQMTVSLILLYQQLGLSFLAGVVFAVLMAAVTKWPSSKMYKFYEGLMKHKDSRIKLMSEILHGIRVIKFYAWEKHFMRKIEELRDSELGRLKQLKYLHAVFVYIWNSANILIAVSSFAAFVLLGNQLTAAKVFTSLTLFNMLIGPLHYLPWLINDVIESRVSLKRIQSFLDLEELDPSTYYSSQGMEDPNSYLEIKQGSFQWDHPQKAEDTAADEGSKETSKSTEKDTDGMDLEKKGTGVLKLSNLNLCVGRGQLVGVIGCVGSGKSSLLSAITAEMTHTGGSISVSDLMSGFGLVPQEAWVQHATLRDNVLFGTEFIAKRYRAVIEACALKDDIKSLPAGDLTEIGENGVTLSGGQKARVALARAVYQDKDLYLLDDPMAAVDAHVGAHIFSQCIMGLLKNKTRILCTHHTKYLQEADLVIVMEGGVIRNAGHPTVILENKDLLAAAQHNGPGVREGGNSPGEEEEEAELWTRKEDGKLVEEEEQVTGMVKFKVYQAYWNAIGCSLATSVLVAMVLTQASRRIADWWLSYWVSHSHSYQAFNSSSSTENITSTHVEVLMTEMNLTGADNPMYYLGIYGGIVGANSIFMLFRAFLFAYGGLCAAKTIHNGLLSSIWKAPVSFFDTTPIGRIINRFSSDTHTIDDNLPDVLCRFLSFLFGTVGTLVLVCYGIPWFSVVLIPIFILYSCIQNYYRKTSRQLGRIESVTMSPIYAHFSETLAGLPTIRALRATERFRLENAAKLEANQRIRFCGFSVRIWLAVCLDLLTAVIIATVAVTAVLGRQYQTLSPGLVGLVLSSTLSISYHLQEVVAVFTELEKKMVSLERVEQYIKDLPSENQQGRLQVAPSWPQHGQVSFKNVSFAYRPSLPNALNGVTFDLQPAEKLGIVGRTGSGKSSLFQVLFRLVEIQSGQVTIDGVDIAHLSLEELRSKLAIIPQDPFLFIGSIRENLDPTGRFSDKDLWVVLEKCHLQSVVESLGGLQAQAGEKGRKFSVGQRQLVCLARAMLTGAKVLCIDEATASVDMATDRLLQRTIRQEFAASTVLTIAHRLDTIMDSDRVLVMSSGQAAELASPKELLEDPTSLFYGLVNKGNNSTDRAG